jgi:hypothetical protein
VARTAGEMDLKALHLRNQFLLEAAMIMEQVEAVKLMDIVTEPPLDIMMLVEDRPIRMDTINHLRLPMVKMPTKAM